MSAATTIPRRAWVEQIMGLPISIHLRGFDVGSASSERQVAAVFADLRHADRVFSTYRTDSDLSRWELGELRLADADPALAIVMELCERARVGTGGWFDARRLPDPRGAGLRYDPSGLVKGWAVQRASRHLGALSDTGWCLNAGGDVLVFAPVGQPPWRIGIEDPAEPMRIVTVVSQAAGAVASSGDAHRGAHIVDPHTGEPARGVRAVTVVGPDLMWADVYATAAAARGPNALAWLAGVDGYAGLLVDRAGWCGPPRAGRAERAAVSASAAIGVPVAPGISRSLGAYLEARVAQRSTATTRSSAGAGRTSLNTRVCIAQ
jgi:FAD:protein FMN transferase